MRKVLLALLASFALISSQAQVSDNEASIARNLVSKNSATIGLSADDLNNYIVSATYVTREGLRMVYLQQSYMNIPVYNEMHVLAFKDGKAVSVTGGRVPYMSKKANSGTGTPAVDAGTAVRTAFAESKVVTQESIISRDVKNGVIDFGPFNVTYENVTAELMWVPINEGKEVRLAWQVQVAPEKTDDMWLIRVDATTNQVIGKNNLTVNDGWNAHDARRFNYVAASNETPSFKLNRPKEQAPPTPIINGASYLVVKYPAESPQHPGGAASLHTDPWTWAPGNATTLKWHSDGTTDYNVTRGNNVWATEDRVAANQNTGLPATSSTPDPLTFNFPPDFTVAPTTPAFQQYAITNLFYWNNLLHDVTYQYGFDEPSGNFQTNNLSRGGLGNDNVMALAQSGAGTNNANFLTPNDGQRGRMRMYLFTAPNPDRDGDLDNGVVCHEFGHGISNRLTGGPANSSCLVNAEEGGEGWGDYNALMLTTNWATATVNDGPIPRAMGTYVLNQATTGAGIRLFRYSTDMSVNPLTYASMGTAPVGTEVHNIGEIWCMMLWEMTWEIIRQTNTINPNLLNPAGAGGIGGNSIAYKLVTEGMRLQPCSPGYVDARDAILKADTLNFGGAYSCAIWRAFAKRGCGRGASQGSSGSASDQTASFVVSSATVKITESSPTVIEGQNLTYTTTVTADNCAGITNYFVTDTLPTHVTYVSGGTYNSGNRTVTFGPITLAAGASQTFTHVVTVNNPTYFAPVTHLNEPVPASIPATWTATSTTATVWTSTTTASNSAPNSFFAPNSAVAATDLSLATTNTYTLNPNVPANYSTLSFWHKFDTEEGWDGGVVEVSTNGGGTWSDLGSRIVLGKYNSVLGTGSALANRAAFSGLQTTFQRTVIDLSSYTGQAIKIRFRFASDNNTAPTNGGWWVDDIVLMSEPAVVMRSSLFNASSVRQAYADTIARILPAVGCVPATITSQPSNSTVCAGANTTFTVGANGTTPAYQWQVNTGSGFANVPASAPYSGTTTNTLTITGVTAAMNGYIYRAVISNTCTPAFNSNPATLNVTAPAVITTNPSSVTICAGSNTSFTFAATGATSLRWQVNTGSGFADVPNAAPYSGVTTGTLTITGATAAMNGYQYRGVATNCSGDVNSTAATLNISVPVSFTTQPASVTVCQGAGVTFTAVTTGTVSGYQWQFSTDGGVTYTNIPGATTTTYSINPAMLAQNNYRFRLVATGSCGPVNSNPATLTVNALPAFVLGNIPSVVCLTDPPITLSASVIGGTWTGTGVSGSVFTPSVAGLGVKTVTYTVTTSGCTTALSASILVNECAGRHLLLNQYPAIYIQPNPSNGAFAIRVNTDLYSKLSVRVFTANGVLIKALEFPAVSFGSILPINLGNVPNGTYQLYIYNDEHGSISRGEKIVVVHN